MSAIALCFFHHRVLMPKTHRYRNVDGELARKKIGAMPAFLAGYIIGAMSLETRGVPEEYRESLLELRRCRSIQA